MKSFLVDVPVMINIWTRPIVQEKTFAVIRKARPSKLFLVSDGPRNEEEKKKILQSRKVVEHIDWDCEVHRLYMDENQGMYAMIKMECDYVFSHVDRCIMLEDDMLASVSFFRFCAELLEKYKDDLRITAINGTNYLGKYREDEADYFFSHGNSIAGYAMWKRTYDLHYKDDVFNNLFLNRELDYYVKNSKGDSIASSVVRNVKKYSENPLAYNHPPAIEFYRSFINVTQSQVDIVPSVNMITNLGGEDGTHVSNFNLLPRKSQRLFFQKHYELEFPLRHPQYVIRDKEYEKILETSKIEKLLIKLEVLCRNIYFLSFRELIAKIVKKLKQKNTIER